MSNYFLLAYVIWNIIVFRLNLVHDPYAKLTEIRKGFVRPLMICAFSLGAMGAIIAWFLQYTATEDSQKDILLRGKKEYVKHILPAALFANFLTLYILFAIIGWPFDSISLTISSIYLMWNIAVLYLYIADKGIAIRNAENKKLGKKGENRISEKSLLVAAFAMGALGAGVGRFLFNHKTNKAKFHFLLPIALFVNVFVLSMLFQFKDCWPLEPIIVVIIFIIAGSGSVWGSKKKNI